MDSHYAMDYIYADENPQTCYYPDGHVHFWGTRLDGASDAAFAARLQGGEGGGAGHEAEGVWHGDDTAQRPHAAAGPVHLDAPRPEQLRAAAQRDGGRWSRAALARSRRPAPAHRRDHRRRPPRGGALGRGAERGRGPGARQPEQRGTRDPSLSPEPRDGRGAGPGLAPVARVRSETRGRSGAPRAGR